MPPRKKESFPATAADQPHVVVILNSLEVVGPFAARRVARSWGREQLAADRDWLAVALTAPDRYVQRERGR
jgi:hypothetical protein